MILVLKALLAVFTVLWFLGGLFVIKNARKLFGKDADHENETPGARSYGIVHMIVIWVSVLAVGAYFFYKI